MTTYTAIADTDIDVDSPVTTGLMTKLRDNPIAITEGASGAPNIQTAAIANSAVTTAKIADSNVTTAKIANGAVTLAKLDSSIIPIRAWVQFDASGTVTLIDDENVSSITDVTTGQFTVNFTTAFANATYAGAGCIQYDSGASSGNLAAVALHNTSTGQTTSAMGVTTASGNSASYEPDKVTMIFAGDQ